MSRSRRICLPGILNHVYQRSLNGFLLFYSTSDYLVYFTLFCIEARKYRVEVLMLCLMPDHIHMSVVASTRRDLSRFEASVSSKFAKASNQICHRSGPLFEKPFGSVPKLGAKKARANLIYVGNNPVERQLCAQAESYRWNFIAYGVSDHPFSDQIVIRRASKHMVRALAEIRATYQSGNPLSYNLLQRLFAPLSLNEKNQLTDAVVSLYSVIDHKAAARFFDGYERMLEAMHTNTGSEYDLNEVFVGRSDACYARIVNWLIKRFSLKDIHDIFLLPETERISLLPELIRSTGAPPEQISKLLRIPLRKSSSASGLY